jgi:hypothetical protein
MKELFISTGIEHVTFIAYAPEMNGFIERAGLTFIIISRSVRIATGLPENLWPQKCSSQILPRLRNGKSVKIQIR